MTFLPHKDIKLSVVGANFQRPGVHYAYIHGHQVMNRKKWKKKEIEGRKQSNENIGKKVI